MKVLKPSSCHMCMRSFDPTIIGYHMCPISWVMTLYNAYLSGFLSSIASIGYSIPLIGPSTALICGYGYWNQRSEYSIIDMRDMSAASFHVSMADGRKYAKAMW